MKIFHLADLHIGKNVNGFSMIDDQIYILEQILHLIKQQQIDAVILAGDIYDKQTPSTEAVQVFDWFLTSLVRQNTAVLIVSGNHDSPERLSFANKIISEKGVYVCGAYDGHIHTVTLTDGFGDIIFHLLPFIKPSNVRRFFETQPIETYEDALKAVLASAHMDTAKRNILVAHQFFISPGQEAERSDSEISVGGIDAIHGDILTHFDYVALGHLHKPQKVGQDWIRYAGSPLKYSASEWDHKKSILMITLGEKGNLLMTPLPLTPFRDMRKIKGPLAALTSQEILSQENTEDYIHVTLTDEDEIIDPMGKLRSRYPHVMTLAFDNSRTNISSDFSTLTAIDNIAPFALFEAFFAEQNGSDMKERQAHIIQKLLIQTGGSQ